MNPPHRLRAWLTDKRNWRQIIIPLALIAVLFIIGRLVDLDKYLLLVQEEVRSFGPWGPLVYIGIYVAATLLLLPSIPFTILAAFLFTTLRAYLTVVGATTLAATSAFLIARYLARDVVEKRFARTDAFIKVKRLVEDNRWFAIPFLRLMPLMPFGVNDYALGLTRVPFWVYFAASEIVFLPMNGVFIFGATTLYRAVVKGQASWVLMAATGAAALLVLLFGYLGKRYLSGGSGAGGKGSEDGSVN
jgi:uncharacterized membrane protein YdjX (TVP38/TMEM64 family)